MNVIKEDIEEESYEEFTSNLAPWGTIMFISREKNPEDPHRDYSVHVSWKKSYDKTAEWLKEKGYYENARIMAEDIDYVVVEKINNPRDIDKIYETAAIGGYMHGANKVEIRDKDKTEFYLNNYIGHYQTTGKYVLGFYMKNGGNFLGWIDEEKLPQDIKDTLNKL